MTALFQFYPSSDMVGDVWVLVLNPNITVQDCSSYAGGFMVHLWIESEDDEVCRGPFGFEQACKEALKWASELN